MNITRRPASTGIFFAGKQTFWSTFAHSYKRDYCSKSSLRKFSTKNNSTTAFYILCKRRGTTVFLQIFCLTLPRNFVGEQFGVSEKNVYRKILCIKMGYHQTPLNKHFLTVTMKFVGEHFCVSNEFWYRNIFSGLSIFLSHRTETESFVRETFCFFRKKPGIEKKLCIRGGISRFSIKICVSPNAKNFQNVTLLFLRNFLVSNSFMDDKGDITFFRRNVLISQCRKVSRASLQWFKKFGVSKNFVHNRRYPVFRSKFFGLTVAKNFVKESFSNSLISGIKKFYA